MKERWAKRKKKRERERKKAPETFAGLITQRASRVGNCNPELEQVHQGRNVVFIEIVSHGVRYRTGLTVNVSGETLQFAPLV